MTQKQYVFYNQLMRKISVVLLSLLITSLSACGVTQRSSQTDLITEPDDIILRQNLTEYFEKAGQPVSSTYAIQRADLNGDGLRDAVILMRAPYGYWCSLKGCPLFIAQARHDRFDIIQSITPVREPVYLGDTSSNGWRDIVLNIYGREDKARIVRLKFNGQTYPQTPDHLFHEDGIDLKSLEKFFDREGT